MPAAVSGSFDRSETSSTGIAGGLVSTRPVSELSKVEQAAYLESVRCKNCRRGPFVCAIDLASEGRRCCKNCTHGDQIEPIANCEPEVSPYV